MFFFYYKLNLRKLHDQNVLLQVTVFQILQFDMKTKTNYMEIKNNNVGSRLDGAFVLLKIIII